MVNLLSLYWVFVYIYVALMFLPCPGWAQGGSQHLCLTAWLINMTWVPEMWKNSSKSSSLLISNCQSDCHHPFPSSLVFMKHCAPRERHLPERCQFYGDIVADLRWSWMQLEVLYLYKKGAFVSDSKHWHYMALSVEFQLLILYYREQNTWSAEGIKACWGHKRWALIWELGKPMETCAWCKPTQVRGSFSICFSRSWPKPRVIRWDIVLCLIKVQYCP